jgi:hypothetical protein
MQMLMILTLLELTRALVGPAHGARPDYLQLLATRLPYEQEKYFHQI